MQYLLLTDETNTRPDDTVRFFIYGATIIKMDRALTLHNAVRDLKAQYGYGPEHELKFDTRAPRPDTVGPDEFRAIKNRVLEIAHEHEVRFMAKVTHHSVVKEDQNRELEWSLRLLISCFDRFLRQSNGDGMAICDRFRDDLNFLGKVFIEGVSDGGPGYGSKGRLERVWMCGATGIRCSHLASVTDIAVGALRFCVNELEKKNICQDIYGNVHRLLLRNPDYPDQYEEYGIYFRPKELRKPGLSDEYSALKQHLRDLASAAALLRLKSETEYEEETWF